MNVFRFKFKATESEKKKKKKNTISFVIYKFLVYNSLFNYCCVVRYTDFESFIANSISEKRLTIAEQIKVFGVGFFGLAAYN